MINTLFLYIFKYHPIRLPATGSPPRISKCKYTQFFQNHKFFNISTTLRQKMPLPLPTPYQHPTNSYHGRSWLGVGKDLITGS